MRQATLAVLLSFCAVPLTAGTLYFSQVADGGGYVTTFTIINPTASAATGTVKLTDSSGNPWSITLADGSRGSQFSISIPAMGSVRLVSAGVGQIKTGWASLVSQANLSGVETFDYRSGSTLLDSVGVVGTPSANRFVLPVDTSSKADTAFAVANVGTTDATIRLTLKAEGGNTVSSIIDPRCDPLSAQKYLAIFTSQIFPTLKSGSFKGSLVIEVVGDESIAATGLSYKEGQSSAVPVVPGSESTSREKAEQLLGHWIFTYTVISQTTDTYDLTALYQDTEDPEQWHAGGISRKDGEPALAGWSADLGQYLMIHEASSHTDIYRFDFTGPNSVSGSYQSLFSDGKFSAQYALTGIRTSTSPMLSQIITQPGIDKTAEIFSEKQSVGSSGISPDPILLKEILKEKDRLESLLK